MLRHLSTALAATLLLVSFALAGGKSKDKPTLRSYFLTAHTVAVIVDPSAGVSLEDPRANQIAQKDVEAALTNWGRFLPVLDTTQADLIIVIRKGSGRLTNVTVPDARQNSRPGSITPTDDGISLGAQRGTPPQTSTGPAYPPISSRPQAEIGGSEDSFLVYEGTVSNPLDGTPGWRYDAPDALHSHNVPAVDRFRKAIADAEKAAAAKQSQQNPPSAQTNPSTPQQSNP
ncbi:hypothetical protein [Granulicella sp. dw_53]|uniref:hypothetical protein n=1 Tax=Granulicella sp. dw_53 TaxID=2719792 RepID=UPI001BD6083D|nr:hypothetical protein [Granulicella sp. dw_53]